MRKTCVIFDWAGTTVDFGSCALVEVFLKIFDQEQVPVTYEEARKPMGKLKIDHIRTMLQMDRIHHAWKKVHGKSPDESDVNRLYEQFETALFLSLKKFTTPLEGVVETMDTLRKMGIRIGSTTGYTREMIDIVSKEAAKHGYHPDCIITADDVNGHGRPAPFMIYENMFRLLVTNIKEVVKIGDTAADIAEGKNAGCYTIGVIIGSSEMGLTEIEFNNLTLAEQNEKIDEVRQNFIAYGADVTIESIKELPSLLDKLNHSTNN